MSDAVVIDMKVHGERVRMAQIISMLSIQEKTGMTHSQGSVIKLAQQLYGIKGRTAKTAGDQVRAIYQERYGKAFGKK